MRVQILLFWNEHAQMQDGEAAWTGLELKPRGLPYVVTNGSRPLSLRGLASELVWFCAGEKESRNAELTGDPQQARPPLQGPGSLSLRGAMAEGPPLWPGLALRTWLPRGCERAASPHGTQAWRHPAVAWGSLLSQHS